VAGKRSIGVRHHCGGFGYDSGGGWTQERQVEDAPGLFLCLGGGDILVDMVQNLGLWSALVARNPSEGVRYHCSGLWYDSGGSWLQERQVQDAFGLFLCLGGGEILVDMVQNLGLWSVLVARNPSEGVRYHCRGLWYDYGDSWMQERQV
jgi:hypothetical protein